MSEPLMDPTIDHETWWKNQDKRGLEGLDFTEYGDPQNRTGTCLVCDRMYACEC